MFPRPAQEAIIGQQPDNFRINVLCQMVANRCRHFSEGFLNDRASVERSIKGRAASCIINVCVVSFHRRVVRTTASLKVTWREAGASIIHSQSLMAGAIQKERPQDAAQA